MVTPKKMGKIKEIEGIEKRIFLHGEYKEEKRDTIEEIMQRISVRGIREEIEKAEVKVEQIREVEPPTPLSNQHRADLIKWAENNRKRGDKQSLQHAIEHYEEILIYEKTNEEIINKIHEIYKDILKLPEGEKDENVWKDYAEFCGRYGRLEKAITIFQVISNNYKEKLETTLENINRKRYTLTLTFDVKNDVVTADLKGEGHCTNVYRLGLDEDGLKMLQRDARRVTIGDKSDWLLALRDIGKRTYEYTFQNKDWKWMFLECYRERGIIEFKIEENYIEFPIELLFYANNDFIAPDIPIRKHILDMGDYINRKPLSAEYYTGEPLKALLVASNVGNLDEVNEEIKETAKLLLDRQSLFDFETVTCLTDDATIADIDPRIKRKEPTTQNFRNELEKGGYHLLHYGGHELFQEDDTDRNSVLLFKDNKINLTELKASLAKSSLRFIYFSCCKSGQQGSRGDDSILLGNVRTSLIAGVPAVLAMRWAIYDDSARIIAEKFYESFVKNGCPEFALQEAKRYAREELEKKDKNDVSWAAPMLIMH